MLDSNLRTELQAYLERLVQPIELIASLDEHSASAEMRELLQEIAQLSPKITLRTDGTAQDIDLQFHAATDDGSALYVSSIALIQTETA